MKNKIKIQITFEGEGEGTDKELCAAIKRFFKQQEKTESVSANARFLIKKLDDFDLMYL